VQKFHDEVSNRDMGVWMGVCINDKVNNKLVHVATQYVSAPCKLTVSSHLFARWHLFRHIGYLRH